MTAPTAFVFSGAPLTVMLLLVVSCVASNNPTSFNVGGVLSNNESEKHFETIVKEINFKPQYVEKGVTYHPKSIIMDRNPIRTALNVCEHLIKHKAINCVEYGQYPLRHFFSIACNRVFVNGPNFSNAFTQHSLTPLVLKIKIDYENRTVDALVDSFNIELAKVYAVIVSHPLTGDLSPAAVSYTSGFFHIPVIGISSRDSAFSDKNIHVSFLRTVPPYSHQADVWVELLKHFNYMKVIFIHSSDTDGRALLGRFQTTSQSLQDDVEIKVKVGAGLARGRAVVLPIFQMGKLPMSTTPAQQSRSCA